MPKDLPQQGEPKQPAQAALPGKNTSPRACVAEAREHPARTLRRLSRERASGVLSLARADLSARVWLFEGRVAWAECTRQRRSLTDLLAELLEVDAKRVRELARDWHARQLTFPDAVLALPGVHLEQLRRALEEHLQQALSFITGSGLCAHSFVPHAGARPAPHHELSFAPEAVLSFAAAGKRSATTLQALARDVYGACWVDLVSDGSAAGFGPDGAPDARLLEAADALIFGHADDIELCVLRCARGTWAGVRTGEPSAASSAWIAFAPHVRLGGVFLGLQAAAPLASRSGPSPSVPSLQVAPSLFPAPVDQVSFRELLRPALQLGDGASAAHLFVQGATHWGTRSGASLEARAALDGLARADSLLEICASLRDPTRAVCDGVEDLVMLSGPRGFHVGASVPEVARTSLFLTFAPGASYGQSTAALAAGVSALRNSLRA